MWIRRFTLHHGKRRPSAMGAEEVNAFLTHLAVEQTVSASTQRGAAQLGVAADAAWLGPGASMPRSAAIP